MCAQCASNGALVATVAATGGRVWLAAAAPAWLSPAWLRALSALVICCGVLAAGLLS